MRNLFFKDKSIPQAKFDLLLTQYSEFHKKASGLTLNNIVIEYDFKNYPTVLDSDGDDRPTDAFVKALVAQGEAKYGKYGFDNVILEIDLANWKSGKTATRKGIWGTNYSYKYGPYHVQYCRWDPKNIANSFGTLNHEQDHSYDALVAAEIDVQIAPILGVDNYDRNTTHGQPVALHGYIKYQENAAKLKKIAPYLKSAYQKRLDQHTATIIGKQKSIIKLLEDFLEWYRQKQNIKNGNPK